MRFRRWAGSLSVRTRVTVMVTALAAAALTTATVFGLDRMEAALIADTRANAEGRLDDFVGGLQEGIVVDEAGAGQVFFLDESGRQIPESEFHELVTDEAGGTIIAASGRVPTFVIDAPSVGGSAIERIPAELFELEPGVPQQLPSGPDVVAVGRAVDLGGTPITIGAANPLQPVTDSLRALTRAALVAVPLLVAAIALACWWVVGRALRPVDAITSHVHRIRTENLHERVPEHLRRDEVGRLAETMNEMLGRLDASNRSQRRFVSDASHELRSPITASLATLEVARAHPDDADWGGVADTVLTEQRRLAHLVDDLLVLARLDEVGDADRSIDVDLEELALSEAERPHEVVVAVKVVDPARISGDPNGLRRALRNIIDNAARHADSRVDVTVSCADDVAKIEVVDDGGGIEQTDQHSLFERFTRVDDDRNRSHGGAGLGLAIAHRIVDAHDGSIDLASTVGVGTTVTVTLPC